MAVVVYFICLDKVMKTKRNKPTTKPRFEPNTANEIHSVTTTATCACVLLQSAHKSA